MEGSALRISRFHVGELQDLADALNDLMAGTPHCPRASASEVASALDGPGSCKAAERLSESTIWLAREGSDIVGVAHAAIEQATEQSPLRAVLRFFAYRPGYRRVGQALVERAEELAHAHGAGEVVAWHYDHKYPWCHAEHALLSGRLGHVQALLSLNGYAADWGQLVLDWQDYAVSAEPLPVDAELEWEWAEATPGATELVLHAYQEGRSVGLCVCIGQGALQRAPEAQDWVYVRWLWVEDGLRGRGLGRCLVTQALAAYRQRGYRHVTIGAMESNLPARLLYTNMGFQTTDWTRAYRKVLA